jgi:hypothetical protein
VVVAVGVSVGVSVIPNSACPKAKEGYCCPSRALDAKSPVPAIEKTAAAMSNPFVNVCCVGLDSINQWQPNLDIMTYTRYFGTKYFVFIVHYDTEALRTPLTR